MPNTAPTAADFDPVEGHPAGTPFTGLGILAVGVITIAALYFGREVFVPMAVALLLSFALGPAVLLLRDWYINRAVAVIAVVVLAFAGIAGRLSAGTSPHTGRSSRRNRHAAADHGSARIPYAHDWRPATTRSTLPLLSRITESIVPTVALSGLTMLRPISL
jgi:hypothetical protein